MFQLKFDESGLVPVIVQDWRSQDVLMQAWANQEAINHSLGTGRACYYSRSRDQLWQKGETSGNFQAIKEIRYDCDADCLLYLVEQQGNACHTGELSCFHNLLPDSPKLPEQAPRNGIVAELYQLLLERKRQLPSGSYSTKLFKGGIDRILKKIGEEAGEVVIAGKNADPAEVVYEVADLCFHTLLLLAELDIDPGQVVAELERRKR